MTAIRSVAIAPGGKLIVAAISAISADGRLAAGLVFLRDDGSVTSMVRTNPFHAASVVFTHDGRLAALGMVADEGWKEIPGHRVLRFYDLNGAFLSETLPVESARVKGDHPGAGGQLVARPAGVAIVNRTHRTLIEVDSDDSVRTLDFSSAMPDNADFAGIAYQRTGRRIVATRAGDRSTFIELFVTGKRVEGRPLVVRLPPHIVHGPALIGADGERLVLSSDGRVFLVTP